MNTLHLDAKKTALVLIDLQNFVMSMPIVPHIPSDVVQRCRSMAQGLRAEGGLVVYVRNDLADLLWLPVDLPFGEPNAPPPPPIASELLHDAGFESDDLVITKRHWGAFAGTELEQHLKQRGIETIVIAGVASRFGVESTVRQGTGLGFAFVIVEDASSDLDAEAHRIVFESIFPRLGRVRKTDEVIAAFA